MPPLSVCHTSQEILLVEINRILLGESFRDSIKRDMNNYKYIISCDHLKNVSIYMVWIKIA